MRTRSEVARIVDHTLLKPEATPQDIQALIDEAAELGTYSVCVSPSRLPIEVPGTLHIACVCGFPSGAHMSDIKAAEAAEAFSDGAQEVDMVINLSLVKQGDWGGVEADIASVRTACADAVLKVIIESAVLTDEEIVRACQATQSAGADFVKTSTGFHPAGGASVHAVSLMRRTVGEDFGVKASGGIRDAETALAMIDAGANRLGLSSTRKILMELPEG